MKKLNDLFYSFLQVAASTQKLGIMKRKASFRLWRTALS